MKTYKIRILVSLAFLFSYVSYSQQYEAGSTKAEIDVSPGGALLYSVPIEVPKGIKEVQPNVALTFNGQSRNGIAGYGWNITGHSSIARVPSTLYHDGVADPVDADDLDRFALDGQRMILKSGTYGKDGSSYELENYSHITIDAVGQSPFHNGPNHFVVKDGKGNTSWYGNTLDSRGVIEYGISRMQDPYGVTINYSYAVNFYMLRLKTISYGSLTGQTAPNKIDFLYKDRPRPIISYTAGRRLVQDKLLDRIKVSAGSKTYRTYTLQHDTATGNYPRLTTITESNSEGKSFVPISFDYKESESGIERKDIKSPGSRILPGFDPEFHDMISGNFNGRDKVDVLIYNKRDRNQLEVFTDFSASGTTTIAETMSLPKFKKIFPTTVQLANGLMTDRQMITTVREKPDQVTFTHYTYTVSSGRLIKQYDKTWRTFGYNDQDSCEDDFDTGIIPRRYMPGDYNGDGLTDMVSMELGYFNSTCNGSPGNRPCSDGVLDEECCECEEPYRIRTGIIHFLGIGFDASSSSVSESLAYTLSDTEKQYDKAYTFDFNGDGKDDLITYSFDSNKIRVYSLKADQKFEKILDQSIDLNRDTPILFGDYNGDGRQDIANPTQNETDRWYFYINNGSQFTTSTRKTIYYRKSYVDDVNSHTYEGKPLIFSDNIFSRNYLAQDLNGDGKTDLLLHEIITPVHKPSRNYVSERLWLYANDFQSESDPFPLSASINGENNGIGIQGAPFFLQSKGRAEDLEYGYIEGNTIHSYQFKNDAREEIFLTSIDNNEITTRITYADDEVDNPNSQVYTPGSFETYPWQGITELTNLPVVSRIVQTGKTIGGGDIQRTKLFRYHGGISHLQGLGFLGFRRHARTNWFGDGVSELWTTTITDPQYRGATVESWTATSTGRSLPSEFASHTVYDYLASRSTNGVYKLSIEKSEQTNGLTGVKTTTEYEYDAFLNPTLVTTRYPGGNSVVENAYNNDITNSLLGYRIGELKDSRETRRRGKNTFRHKVIYKYTDKHSPEYKIDENNDGERLQEDYEYDTFGNITKKTFNITDKTKGFTSYIYEEDGRRLKETTDHLGETLNFRSDAATGLITSETDRYGRSTSYEHDAWQRIVLETQSLESNNGMLSSISITDEITTTYTRGSYGSTLISKSSTLNGTYRSQVNNMGWEELQSSSSLDGKEVSVATAYDVAGRDTSKSDPYFGNSAGVATTRAYDNYGRMVRLTLPTGRVYSTTYEGLTTTVNDQVNTTSTTVDALGNVTSKTDPGGTVTYDYYANNEMRAAKYGTHVVFMEIDGWGRRKTLIDPSAGTYRYQYDLVGNLKEETTPNGKTTYMYDALGLVESKAIVGKNTNMQISYQRDSYHREKQLTGVDRINSITHKITTDYDGNNRIEQQNERVTGPRVSHTFRRNLSYEDDRLATERYYSEYNGIGHRSEKTIRYHYDPKSGIMNQITDSDSTKKLWSLHQMTARGQNKFATLGNNAELSRAYDKYGNLEEIYDYFYPQTTPLTLNRFDYKYNVRRGLMTFRHNRTIPDEFQTINEESFDYDILDRLTDVSGAESITQAYDIRGNITSNNYVGDYKYDPTKLYQLSEIELNRNGEYRYGKEPRETITYNAYKKPVEIRYKREGDANRITTLEYGPLMNRTQMYYDTDTEVEDKDKRRFYKMYSSIIPAEITYDRTTKATKMVTYLGGTAYSASVAQVKQQGGSVEKIDAPFYLHRDHLGSITSISNTEGKLVEHNYYGAWGEILVGFSQAESRVFNDGTNLLLGRGYTGHEHLAGTSLIHMNGRVYDKDLRRFMAPDNFVQDPYNTQSYNRYSYAWNNPLSYSDPSGEVIIPMLIGAAIGVLTNGISNSFNGEGFFEGAGKAAIIGAISGVFSVGIGDAAAALSQSLTSTGITGFANTIITGTFQAALHGLSAAYFTALQGGNVEAAFAAGAIGSIVGGITSGVGKAGSFGNIAVTTAGGAVSGGIGSRIAGGSFWDGFRSGAIAAGLNHAAHAVQQRVSLSTRLRRAGIDPRGIPKASREYVNDIIDRLPELGRIMELGNNPDIFIEANSLGNPIYQRSIHGITLTKVAFSKGNFGLVSTLFHESFHAIQNVLGVTQSAIETFGTIEYGAGKYLLERDAYRFEQAAGNFNTEIQNYIDQYNRNYQNALNRRK